MSSLEAARLAELESENAQLRTKLAELERKLQFFSAHPTLSAGIRGESIVSRLVAGVRTSKNQSFDVHAATGHHLEVKYSSLLLHSKNSSAKRWAWGKLFGEYGEKNYDYLVLVGDSDYRFSSSYRDPNSPYVMFCLPKGEVGSFAKSMNGGRYVGIWLASRPDGVRTQAGVDLYGRYQITESELAARFSL